MQLAGDFYFVLYNSEFYKKFEDAHLLLLSRQKPILKYPFVMAKKETKY